MTPVHSIHRVAFCFIYYFRHFSFYQNPLIFTDFILVPVVVNQCQLVYRSTCLQYSTLIQLIQLTKLIDSNRRNVDVPLDFNKIVIFAIDLVIFCVPDFLINYYRIENHDFNNGDLTD